MLLVVNLSSKLGSFPLDALRQIDAALSGVGFRKEVHSVIKPGKEFTVTYDGPNIEKGLIQETLEPIAKQHDIDLTVELEESVRFP